MGEEMMRKDLVVDPDGISYVVHQRPRMLGEAVVICRRVMNRGVLGVPEVHDEDRLRSKGSVYLTGDEKRWVMTDQR